MCSVLESGDGEEEENFLNFMTNNTITDQTQYLNFINKKKKFDNPVGLDIRLDELNPKLFDFQRYIVRWALKRGRAAVFANTGLGKAFMGLEWARKIHEKTDGDVIFVTPLAVGEQTMREANKFHIPASHVRSQDDIVRGVNITNYEMLHNFDLSKFVGVVLDESSCIKSFDGKTRAMMIDSFSKTPYRLAMSATPAPNDYMELGNQSEFLGILPYHEMLAAYFVHDSSETQKWRLKGHAQDIFWKWMCSWAVNIQKPSDLGFKDDGYILPPIIYHDTFVETGIVGAEKLSFHDAIKYRKKTIEQRAAKVAEVVNASDQVWVVWCGLNEEGKSLLHKITGSVEIKGSDSWEHKEQTLLDFTNGKIKCLVTKPSIAGFGLNWQHCYNTAYCGINYSFEEEFQSIRRFYRFGQDKNVNVHLVLSDIERPILEVVRQKEARFQEMFEGMVKFMQEETKKEIIEAKLQLGEYTPTVDMTVPQWCLPVAA